jgi:uncharacterized protein
MKLRTLLLAATALTGFAQIAAAGEISFTAITAPTEDAAKREVLATPQAMMDGAEVKLAYHVMARSGDKIGDGIFAQMVDKQGAPLKAGDATKISNSADFTSLLPVGNKLFAITHFEDNPAGMYLSEVAQDGEGNLSFTSTKPLDFAGVGGLWLPCAGTVSPWGTHLGSEEYPDDARSFETATAIDGLAEDAIGMAPYFGLDAATMTVDAFKAAYNPYNYGFVSEISVSEAGDASIVKHYGMGRVAVELAMVMPDQKTTYITDDGSNTGLFMFTADKEGDLTAGTLHAAKWVQTSDEGAGAANLEWVDLGHADDKTIAEALAKGVKFSDMFEVAEFNADGSCPEGFASSNAEGRAECLKIKEGMEAVASRLETRRVASMKGATTEFRKMEGLAFNPEKPALYLAMSEVSKGMTDGDEKADKGGRNDVRLKKNGCGAVYELALDAGFKATTMTGLVAGKPMEYAADAPYAGSTCDIDGIANPDNLTFIGGYNTLVIGEDTGEGHQNDAVWAMDLAKGDLTRIMTTPYGSEATSVDWYPNVKGHAYLMTVVQHPYGESDSDKLVDPADARAYVGYLGPFPAVK